MKRSDDESSENISPLVERIYGDNLVAGKTYTGIYTDTDFKGWSLKSRKPAQEHQIRLALATLQCENPADWETMLNKTISKVQTDKKSKAENPAVVELVLEKKLCLHRFR